MGILDDLAPKLTKTQIIESFIAKQPDADEWRQVMADPKYPHAAIARELLKRGCPLGTVTQANNAVHKLRAQS
jgi:hypothetical protein